MYQRTRKKKNPALVALTLQLRKIEINRMNKLHNILKVDEFRGMKKLWNGIESGEEKVGYCCKYK